MNSDLAAIRSLIKTRHRTRLGALIVKQLSIIVLCYCTASALLQLLFALFPWTMFPLLWDALNLGGVAGIFIVTIATLLLRRPGLLSTAWILEQRAGQTLPHPLLSIAFELGNDPAGNELHQEVLHRAAQQLPAFARLSARSSLSWRLPAAGVTVALFIIAVGFLNPRLTSYWRLPLSMLGGTVAHVTPGSISVPRGASVTLQLTPEKLIAPACQLTIMYEGQGGKMVRWLRDNGKGTFSRTIDSLAISFSYRFSYGAAAYGPESVTVVPPPYVRQLQIKITPPAYTGLPERTLSPGLGDFTAFEGSRAHFSIESSALQSAAIRMDDSIHPLEVTGTRATGTIMVDRGAAYSFELVDTFSQHSDSSMRYTIGLLPDEAPVVRFLRPGKNKILEPSQRESLLVEAGDDLGIRSCDLYWCKSGECDGEPSKQDLSPKNPQRLWQKEFLWNISRLSLYPGDTLYYWARVRDTRSPGRPQYASSDTFFFRLPTIDEIHKAIAVRHNDASDEIGSVLKRQDELMKSVEQLDKATAPRSNAGVWDRQQLAQKIEKAMNAQADSLQKSLEKLEENIRQLNREGDLGEAIAKKMDDVRKAMEDLIKMYGDSLLFPKDESGEIPLDDLRKAVEKLSDMLPELTKRLDNTLKFLEALKNDRELAELAMQAEKLAEEQARLAETDRDNKTASRQKDLLDRINALKNEARQKSGADRQPDKQTMEQIDSLSRDMAQQLSENQTPQAGTMRQMSGNLSSLAQQLREQTSSYMMQQLEALRGKLLDIAANALDLTAWQEQVRTAGMSASEEERRMQAMSQQAITEALGILEEQTDSLPMLPPSLLQKLRADAASAREASKGTVQSLGESDGSFGMRITEQSIKQLAVDLLATANAMSQEQGGSCNSGGSGGMRESLRRMSGKQAAINAATAQLLRSMLQGKKPGDGGEGGDGNGNEAARKEAQAAQEALAKDLKALGEKFGDSGGEGMKERIKQLEEEARSLTQMLTTPREEVTERQDRFLARMLQSALSLHREEEGKEERKSTSAGIVFTGSEGALSDSLMGNNDTFLLLRRQALLGGTYPPDYRQSINAYFDSLGVMFLK